jgi:catechol 2,3-dioxygenase-like lactoylglutathione lyase family enzyme
VSTLLGSVGAISLFVEDLPRAREFYKDVLGLPLVYEDAACAVVRFQNTLVNLLLSSEAPELLAPATVAGPGTGSRFQLSVFVPDVDALCAELTARGVSLLNGPMNRPWGKRTAAFRDPAGHVWEIAQDLPPGTS